MVEKIIVFLAAATPVIEVRGSIPLGLFVYKLDPITVLILSIVGSALPCLPVLWFLKNLTGRLQKDPKFAAFFEWLFTRTRAKSKLIKDLELVGLTLFIAVPLPGTGVWTGTVAAYLLDLPWIPTLICATVGTAIASFLVWAASLGIINFIL